MLGLSGHSIRAVIRREARRLRRADLAYGHGTHDEEGEAVFFVTETLGIAPDALTPELLRRTMPAPQRDIVRGLVDRRIATRKPAPYLLNRAYIRDFPFYVDERVIVPRSFIGELLLRDDGFDPPGMPDKVENILDLCTGSGCLAIIAAHLFPDARIDAADLSPDALNVARRNVQDYGLQDRITLHESDLFGALAGRRYDLIITNPPYVDAEGMRTLPPEYRHEPAMALGAEAGADGLALVRRIVGEAPAHLTPQGGLLCEIGRGRDNVMKAWPRLPFLWLDTAAGAGEVFWITRRKMDLMGAAA